MSQDLQEENRRLRAELAQKEEELRRIKASFGWRLLSRYGRLKYRYLLPVYRLFGADPTTAPEPPTKLEPEVYSAADVAARYARFKTADNRLFFEALCAHLAGGVKPPLLDIYFEFAITTNSRGDHVAESLAKRVDIAGKRYLDIGCAYGGFLVAFARRGAEVAGVDINAKLLDLARLNLRDNRIDAPLSLKDATNPDDMEEFAGRFDIITANDVIEHVPDPIGFLHNVARLLAPGGLVYMAIPNGLYPRFVQVDGHFQLFGITLLDFDDAKAYYHTRWPKGHYDVFNYLTLQGYEELFQRAGLKLELLEENFTGIHVNGVLADLEALRAGAKAGLETVPGGLRKKVGERLESFVQEVQNFPRNSAAERREFLRRYGMSFWNVVARKLRD